MSSLATTVHSNFVEMLRVHFPFLRPTGVTLPSAVVELAKFY